MGLTGHAPAHFTEQFTVQYMYICMYVCMYVRSFRGAMHFEKMRKQLLKIDLHTVHST